MNTALLRPPPQLQAVAPFLKRALQLQDKNPLVAHKCKLYAMSVGLKFANEDPVSISYLKELIKDLERVSEQGHGLKKIQHFCRTVPRLDRFRRRTQSRRWSVLR